MIIVCVFDRLACDYVQWHNGSPPWGGRTFFFFSSRRRHTRCSRDWSSDVCSSDLILGAFKIEEDQTLHDELKLLDMIGFLYEISLSSPRGIDSSKHKLIQQMYMRQKIGRASCRERV